MLTCGVARRRFAHRRLFYEYKKEVCDVTSFGEEAARRGGWKASCE